MHYISSFLLVQLKFLSFKFIVQISYYLKDIIMIIKTYHTITIDITQILTSKESKLTKD